MRIIKPLLFIAIVYNIINLLFWEHISIMKDATSMIYLFIYPSYWIITFIVVVILSLKNKSIWFEKKARISTIILIFFCTPIFFFLIRTINTSNSFCDSSGYIPKKGYTIKYESWTYKNGSRKVIKYWKSDEENCTECDSTHFKKDSTWVYFNDKKDTVKVEVYKNGKLINGK